MKELRIKHVEATVKLNYLLAKGSSKDHNVIELGEEMVSLGLDLVTDGFWIWKGEIEYYSPRFRKALGFDGVEDFPNVPASWQGAIEEEYVKPALDAYSLHLEDPEKEYYLDVVYRKKHSGKVRLICAGTIVNREDPDNLIMIGTHKVIPL